MKSTRVERYKRSIIAREREGVKQHILKVRTSLDKYVYSRNNKVIITKVNWSRVLLATLVVSAVTAVIVALVR